MWWNHETARQQGELAIVLPGLLQLGVELGDLGLGGLDPFLGGFTGFGLKATRFGLPGSSLFSDFAGFGLKATSLRYYLR